MPIENQDLADIIADLKKRIQYLELSIYTYGNPAENGRPDLNITGLTGSVAYYNDGSGEQIAAVTFTWNSISPTDPDNLAADPVVDYMFSITKSTDLSTGLYTSTNGQTSVTISNLAVGVNVIGRVYALSAKGIKGNVYSTTVAVSKDLTPPPQPSTPVLTPRFGGVLVGYDGKDSTGTVMPSDFAHCLVQTSYDNVTFTTLNIIVGNGSYFVNANSTYSTVYVRLLSVDRNDNVNTGVPSTVVSATPLKLVSTDANVVLPGDIGYNETNNMLVDGSFENSIIRDVRANNSTKFGSWTFTNAAGAADHGLWSLRVSGDAQTTKYYYIHDNLGSQIQEFAVYPGTKLYCKFKYRGVSNNGTMNFVIRFRDKDNAFTYTTLFTKSSGFTASYELYEGVTVVPALAVTATVYFSISNMTTGTIDFDSMQVMQVTSNMLIEDAAITTAKIADAAITNAKIESLSAAKITSGEIQASSIISAGPIAGTHTEISSAGLESFVLPATGSMFKAIHIGTNANDILTITDPNGLLVTNISQQGTASFNSLNIPVRTLDGSGNLVSGAVIYGTEFTDHLNTRARGVIAWGSPSSAVTCNTSEKAVVHTQAEIKKNRLYKSTVSGAFKTSNAYGDVAFVVRKQNGSKATTSSSVLKFVGGFAYNSNYNYPLPPLEGIFTSTIDQMVSLGLFAYAYNSGESVTIGEDVDLSIVDIGPYTPNTATISTSTTKQTYVSEWECSNSATYTGANTLRSGITYLEVGYVGYPTYGDQHALCLFTANAVVGETSSTIATATSGATITKAEVFLYAQDWYYNTGGTVQISVNTLTALATTTPNTTKLVVPNWPKPAGVWVDITSLWSTSSRGIWLGKTSSSDLTYFGKFNSHAGPNKPRIRLTYVR